MVKRVGDKDGYRSFTIINVGKSSGCKTKFGRGKYGGRYISKSASAAASKAFSELCRTKRIRGVCTMYITLQETTKNSNHKTYVYKANRQRLKEPLIMMEGTDKEYVIEYKPVVRSVKNAKKCTNNNQTQGRRLKKTAKKTHLTPNNVRRRRSKRN